MPCISHLAMCFANAVSRKVWSHCRIFSWATRIASLAFSSRDTDAVLCSHQSSSHLSQFGRFMSQSPHVCVHARVLLPCGEQRRLFLRCGLQSRRWSRLACAGAHGFYLHLSFCF